MEVSVRSPKQHYDVIPCHCVSKLAYFVEHDIGYQPSKFRCSRVSGSNFMEGVKPLPQCYNEIISSVLIGLRYDLYFLIIKEQLRWHFAK